MSVAERSAWPVRRDDCSEAKLETEASLALSAGWLRHAAPGRVHSVFGRAYCTRKASYLTINGKNNSYPPVRVPVGDGVLVAVNVGVCVTVGVFVHVDVRVVVFVADDVGVEVCVVVGVGVGVFVAVDVEVDVPVAVGVDVGATTQYSSAPRSGMFVLGLGRGWLSMSFLTPASTPLSIAALPAPIW